MATINRESKLNGTLTIETSKEKFVLNSSDHGDFETEIFLTANNDKLTTTYEFEISLISHTANIVASLGQRLVLFDADKNHCILTLSFSDYQLSSQIININGIRTYKRRWKYKIDEENIAKLKELNQRTSKMRLETKTSYVEFWSGESVLSYMVSSIEIAQKAILKSSDDILNF